jgi:rhamnose utilization protein RhaD (predicted bifunctional aldolase and dehydrogenase)
MKYGTRFEHVSDLWDDDKIPRFVNSNDAARLAELGTSCPDHFLRTKIKPLYLERDPQNEDVSALQANLDAGIIKYRQDYTDYYETCKRPNSPAMRDPNPTTSCKDDWPNSTRREPN